MTTLQDKIAKLTESAAHALATEIAHAVRSATLDEIAALNHGVAATKAAPKGKPGRPTNAARAAKAAAAAKVVVVAAPVAAAPVAAKKAGKGGRRRRSAEDIKASLNTIVALLKKSPGLRSEQIQKATKLQKKEIVGPISLGLESGVLKKKGERRATSYFIA